MGPKTVQHEHTNAPAPESPGAPSQMAPGQDACQWQAKAFQDVSMGGIIGRIIVTWDIDICYVGSCVDMPALSDFICESTRKSRS